MKLWLGAVLAMLAVCGGLYSFHFCSVSSSPGELVDSGHKCEVPHPLTCAEFSPRMAKGARKYASSAISLSKSKTPPADVMRWIRGFRRFETGDADWKVRMADSFGQESNGWPLLVSRSATQVPGAALLASSDEAGPLVLSQEPGFAALSNPLFRAQNNPGEITQSQIDQIEAGVEQWLTSLQQDVVEQLFAESFPLLGNAWEQAAAGGKNLSAGDAG